MPLNGWCVVQRPNVVLISEDEANKHGARKTVYTPGGVRYTGSWRDNERHGKGVLIHSDGSKYEGDWEHGLRHGHGTLWSFADGKYRLQYSGQWQNDAPNGVGIFHTGEGDVYEGDWVDGRRHGRGRMTYGGRPVDGFGGDVYEGSWQDDCRHGEGTMTYSNNNVYEGYWHSDVRHGMGTLFYTDKGKRFDGLWHLDSPKSGSYSEIEPTEPGTSSGLPVLELEQPGQIISNAIASCT